MQSLEFPDQATGEGSLPASGSFLTAGSIMALVQTAILGAVALVLGLFVVRPLLMPPPALPAPEEEGQTIDLVADGPESFGALSADGTAAPDELSAEQEAERNKIRNLREIITERQEESAAVLLRWIDAPDPSGKFCLMRRKLRLEEFVPPEAERLAGNPDLIEEMEREALEAQIEVAWREGYEAGVRSGTETAARVHAEAQDQLRSALIEAIAEGRQSHVEAQAAVLSGAGQVFARLVHLVTPLLAKAGLAEHAAAAVSDALRSRPDAIPVVRCAPETTLALENALAARITQLQSARTPEIPYRVEADPRLSPLEAEVHWDDGFDAIALEPVLAQISEALETLSANAATPHEDLADAPEPEPEPEPVRPHALARAAASASAGKAAARPPKPPRSQNPTSAGPTSAPPPPSPSKRTEAQRPDQLAKAPDLPEIELTDEDVSMTSSEMPAAGHSRGPAQAQVGNPDPEIEEIRHAG